MEIVKENNEELVMRSDNGTSIRAEKLADGGVRIHNSDGPSITLSPEKAQEVLNAVDPDKKFLKQFNPISLVSSPNTYPSVKEALQDSTIKGYMLESFSEILPILTSNKWVAQKKNAGPEIAKCVIEYPKVIVESHFTEDVGSMVERFKEVDAIKLPFPKMTVITGERSEDSDGRITISSSLNQNGEVNFIYGYFLSQTPDGIDVDMMMARQDRSMILIHTATIVHDGEQLRFLYDDSEPRMAKYIHSAITAIYMMTMSKNNFYMSVPTPEEAATNRKRISKGKKPLIEFKVATIEGKKTMLSSTPHGTHASPRLHWRRGHWRTMTKSGKKTWIAPMEVGDEDNGRVIKTYAIGKYSLMEAR